MQYRNFSDVERGIDRIIAAMAKEGQHKTIVGRFSLMCAVIDLGYAFDSDIPIFEIQKITENKLAQLD